MTKTSPKNNSHWIQKIIGLGVMAVVVVIIAAAILGGGKEKVTNDGVPVGTVAAAEPAQSQSKVAGLPGAVAEAKNVRVTLNQIVDPWASDNEFIQPEAGKRIVAFDVTIENVGKTGTHGANPFNFKLTDGESFAYEASFFGPDPALHFIGLGSGEKTRGWVAFEVAEIAPLAVLKYDPEIFTTDDIEFRFQ